MYIYKFWISFCSYCLTFSKQFFIYKVDVCLECCLPLNYFGCGCTLNYFENVSYYPKRIWKYDCGNLHVTWSGLNYITWRWYCSLEQYLYILIATFKMLLVICNSKEQRRRDDNVDGWTECYVFPIFKDLWVKRFIVPGGEIGIRNYVVGFLNLLNHVKPGAIIHKKGIYWRPRTLQYIYNNSLSIAWFMGKT